MFSFIGRGEKNDKYANFTLIVVLAAFWVAYRPFLHGGEEVLVFISCDEHWILMGQDSRPPFLWISMGLGSANVALQVPNMNIDVQ